MTKKEMTEEESLKAKYALPEGKHDSLSFEQHQALVRMIKSGALKVEAPNGENVKFDTGEE